MTRTAALFCALFVAAGCDETLGGGNLDPLFDGDDTLVGSQSSVSITTADSEPVIVDVPSGAASFAVVLSGLGNTLAQPATITTPAGVVVFEAGMTTTNRSDAFAHVSTTLVPVNPDVSVEAGEWEFVFFGSASANATIDAVFRLDGSPSSGTLDVNLHFVGLDVLDASTAADDADFQAVLDGVASIYSSAGVTLGERQYFDVDDDAFSVLTTSAVGSDELLTLLERHTADRDNRAVNLFFVADIEDPTSSASLLGVSGGVPGPPGLHGTKRSGVAINMANYIAAVESQEGLADAQAEVELIVAHELGHFLGLFHTTEANGAALPGGLNGQDPLSDTAVCPDDADSDGNGILSSSECSGADGSNLMFWSPPNGATTLTSGQRHVVQRNPVVQ